MTEKPLKEFCEGRTQEAVAKLMGRSQGAVSQMLKSGREIIVVSHEDGTHSWYERKWLNSKGSRI